jgi:hypothetical protein
MFSINIIHFISLTKTQFQPYFAMFFLFVAETRKYHPVVVLLHIHKWLKKISTKFRQVLKQCKCILSPILCPLIFCQIAAIAMLHRFSAR